MRLRGAACMWTRRTIVPEPEAHEIKMLTAENAMLRTEIENTKAELVKAERANSKGTSCGQLRV